MHTISDEFEFRPDRTADYQVSYPWASKKFPIDLQWENGVSMLAQSILIESSSKLLVNQDRHNSTAEFDFGPNQTTHFGITWPWVMRLSHFWTWISLKPVGQSWSNFMCSIIGVGESLHKVLGQIGSKLVSMATENPHWLIMGKMMYPSFLGCFWSDPFYTCR